METNIDTDFFSFGRKILFRAPSLSLSEYDLTSLSAILQNDFFKVAIFLASPDLYQVLEKKKFVLSSLTQKELLAIQKYYNRMCFRPTPFGAFSSFTLSSWTQNEDVIKLKSLHQSSFHINLSQVFIQNISDIVSVNDSSTCYLINPTLYKLSNEYRFIKTDLASDENKLLFSLHSFNTDVLVTKIIKYLKVPKTYTEIHQLVISLTGCGIEEGREFVSALVQAQVIMSLNGARVLGPDYVETVVKEHLHIPEQLRQMLKKAEFFKNLSYFPSLDRMKEINTIALDVATEVNVSHRKNLLYINQQRFATGGLDETYQTELKNALKALNELSVSTYNSNMDKFIKAVKKRFDRQPIPLLLLLDPEAGVIYGNQTNVEQNSQMLKDIRFDHSPNLTKMIKWTAVHILLLNKITAADSGKIELTKDDIDFLGQNRSENQVFPPSFSVLFSIVDDQIVIDAVGGTSAASIIGRFTPYDSEILQTVLEITEHEQKCNPDIIFAEVSFLSDNHVDNINRRRPVYQYEIVINTAPCPEVIQIRLSDLQLRVVDNELILESISLKKRIIPRLSSAYNHQNCDLTILRFLCDLQYLNVKDNFQLDLENLFPGMDSYPRVFYGKTIFCLAKWRLNESDILSVTSGSDEFNLLALVGMCHRKHIPSSISLVNTDQHLAFKLHTKEEALMFVACIRGAKNIIIREYIRPNFTGACSSDMGCMAAQFLAPVFNKSRTYKGYQIIKPLPISNRVRNFDIGSEWLYLKVYCTPERSNSLLSGKFMPFISNSLKGHPYKWFFVRYLDDGYHLRIRILLPATRLGIVLSSLAEILSDSLNYNLIRDYKADRYNREIERYGFDLIEIIEDVFFKSSGLVVKFWNSTGSISTDMFAMKTTYDLITVFLKDEDERIKFVDVMTRQFLLEYADPKALKFDMDKKYRTINEKSTSPPFNTVNYSSIGLSVEANSLMGSVQQVVAKLLWIGATEQRRFQILADLIHMHLNRLFISRQRDHELIVYYFLAKNLKAWKAKTNR